TGLRCVTHIALVGLRQPVPYVPGLLYEVESSFTNFLRWVGASGVRADIHPRVSLPVPVAGLFTVTPFGGWRATYYNNRVVGTSVRDGVTVEDPVHDALLRLQLEGGFDVESRASRVFQLDGAGGLAALQHVIEPRLQVLEIGGANQGENPQFDPAIDKIGRVSTLTYSLINR